MEPQRGDLNQVFDVVVIGAGISGSYAAYLMSKRCKDLKILVVEAKDRVGGRTFTAEVNSANGKSRWDLGGQWVCANQKKVTSLLEELNIETYRQYDDGRKMLLSNGQISSYNSSVPCSSFLSWLDMLLYMVRVNKYLKKISTVDPYENKKLADDMDKTSLKSFLNSKSMTSTTRAIFNSNMRTIYGLEINQVNNLFGLMYVKSSGGVENICYSDQGCAQESRVKGGTQQISRKLLDRLLKHDQNKLILNTALVEIVQDDINEDNLVEIVTQNTVTGEKMVFKAKKVVSSIPINQYIHVKFSPELPLFKRNFFKFCQIGNYIKFLVTYKTPFWRAKGLSGEGTSDGSYIWLNKERFNKAYAKDINKLSFNKVIYLELDLTEINFINFFYLKQIPTIGAVAEVFDGTNEENQPALVGFVAADAAVQWGDQSEEVRRNEVIEGLVKFYGVEARDYIAYTDKNWNLEPYNGGCPAFNVSASGLMSDYARATREPFYNVHFCGTESATEWQGYMDGAIESGFLRDKFRIF